MKVIQLPVNDLKTALAGLSRITGRHSTLPVLGCVLVERSKFSTVTLTANNLDQAAVVSLDADSPGEPAAVLVPLRDLSEVVKRCGRNDTISVSSDEEASGLIRYPVASTMAEHRFDFLPVAEFPPLPEVKGEPVPMPEPLKRSLQEAFQCASDDETRYVLNGAFIDVSEPKCHQVVGTNGRIIYAANSFDLALEKSVIVPTNRFLNWKPFLDDGDWTMKLGERKKDSPANFQISSLRWRFFGREIEGNYPNYRQVVPGANACQTTVEFDPAGLDDVIRTIGRMPCHDAVNHTIQLQVRRKAVSLLGKSPGSEDWTEVELQLARAGGKDVRIAFNRQYLTKALGFGLNTIQIIDAMSPGRFYNGGRQMIVMPVRAEARANQAPGPAPVPPPAPKPPGNATPIAQPDGSPDPSPAPASPTKAEAPTTERKDTMQSSQTAQPPAVHGADGSTNNHAEPPSSLISALERIEAIKGSYREAIRGLNGLADLLKQAARDQKASDKEISSVRQTLRSLQSVRL